MRNSSLFVWSSECDKVFCYSPDPPNPAVAAMHVLHASNSNMGCPMTNSINKASTHPSLVVRGPCSESRRTVPLEQGVISYGAVGVTALAFSSSPAVRRSLLPKMWTILVLVSSSHSIHAFRVADPSLGLHLVCDSFFRSHTFVQLQANTWISREVSRDSVWI